MLKIIFAVAIFGFISNAQGDPSLKEFESDGCTLFMEGPPRDPDLWAGCCFEHDLRYWFGGTLKNRDDADSELRDCVSEKAGSRWANVIYKAVKWGHRSPIKSRYSWGWGWDPERDFSPLKNEEISYIRHRISKLELDSDFMQRFSKKYLDPLEEANPSPLPLLEEL